MIRNGTDLWKSFDELDAMLTEGSTLDIVHARIKINEQRLRYLDLAAKHNALLVGALDLQ